MSPILHFISTELEPFAYAIFTIVLFFYCFIDKRPSIKVITGYYVLATILLIKATFFIENNNNISTYSLVYLMTSAFMGVYFHMTLTAQWKKIAVIGLCAVEVIYYIKSSVLYPAELPTFDSAGFVILSTAMMIMVFMFMHQLLANVKEEKLSMNFDFWFVCSQMIYHFGSFIIFLTFSYLTKKILPADYYSVANRLLMMRIWGIHNVLLLLSSLVTCGSILWIVFHRKSASS